MEQGFLDEVKRYIGFGAEDARALVELRPLLERNAARVIDVFYERILAHPRASRAIAGGAVQVERLKATLRRWLVELAGGDYDESYLVRRAAIGRMHVRIALPQVFMVTAMDVVRRELTTLVRAELARELDRRERTLDALHKILDVDLAIMLETYHEASLAKIVESERRAAIGGLAARVNHELRARLGVIKSSAFLLERQLGAAASEPVAKHLKKIQRGAESAGSIVAAILNLAHELKPSLVPIDLNQLVREAVGSVATPPNAAVELRLTPEPPRVLGDPELLQSVIVNLVQNAVEAHEGLPGRVVVATEVEGATARLRVLDGGLGIPPEVVPRLFEPLFTTKPGAAGLGLAISREVVTAHGGRIEARNRADGKGAELVVELALERRGVP